MARRALVTGGSRGIGRAIAARLARDGFAVSLGYRERRDAAEEARKEIESAGGEARVLGFDVADRDACREVLEADLAEHGPYYAVVCNAGIRADGPFPGLKPDEWDRVLRTNLDSFYNVLHPLVMPMVRARQGGRILTLTSAAGILGNRGQTNYGASKAGLIGATKSLALELAKRKITCNAVAPGLIETEMIEGVAADVIEKMVPMQRLGSPEEVASVVSFLASDEASYVTGQVISVNGGLA